MMLAMLIAFALLTLFVYVRLRSPTHVVRLCSLALTCSFILAQGMLITSKRGSEN